MGTFFGFSQVKNRAAGDNIHLKVNIVLKNILQCQNLRFTADNRQQDNTIGDLHLRISVQAVEDNIRRGFPLEGDFDMHTVTVGMIVNIGDTL